MFGTTPLQCLALCEIIDKKEDFTHWPGKGAGKVSGGLSDGIYVVPREEYVTTRFFIVNPASSSDNADGIVRKALRTGNLGFLARAP